VRERVDATGQAFLRKPFEETELLETINRMLTPAAQTAAQAAKKKPRRVP